MITKKEITVLEYQQIDFGLVGLSKEKVRIDLWQKDIAPSNSLRKWFGHDENKWDEFKRKYFKELDKKNDNNPVDRIIKMAKEQNSITLLYGTKEERFNNAVALKEYLEEKTKKQQGMFSSYLLFIRTYSSKLRLLLSYSLNSR